ncbi:MAG: flagellar biosynthesis protein FliQ [Candidatus Margulisiibacteriota bacterium]|jgi:flagellar biosynthetic protein FliQ
MDLDTVTIIVNSAVNVIVNTSLPTIGVGLVVGLLIAVFQAVTQIQEQTLTFVPKMIAVMFVLALTFPWMASIVMEFATSLWINIPLYSK